MKEWLTVFVATLAALIVIGFVSWVGTAHGADAPVCDYPESLLTDALKDDPTRLIKKLEGHELGAFLSKMEAAGYMSGVLPNVTAIYVISGKLMPGHHEPIDILFFISGDHCIVGKVYGTASVVEGML